MIILVFSALYWSFEGIREGYYWSLVMKSNDKVRNNHDLFLAQRTFVMLFILMYSGWLDALLFCSSSPFFHNGSYYETRKKLDGIYLDGWWSQSSESTAKTTWFFTPIVRVLLLVLSFTIYCYFKLN